MTASESTHHRSRPHHDDEISSATRPNPPQTTKNAALSATKKSPPGVQYIAIVMERPDNKTRWGLELKHCYPNIWIHAARPIVRTSYTKWTHVSDTPPPPEAYYSRCTTDDEYFQSQFPSNSNIAVPAKNQCLIPGDLILTINGKQVFTCFRLRRLTESLRAERKLIIIAKRHVKPWSGGR